MIAGGLLLGYPKDLGSSESSSFISNPFTAGDRPSHVDKILVLPVDLIKELGVMEFYGTVKALKSEVKHIIGTNKIHSKYWCDLLKELVDNDDVDLVAAVYGGPCADADLQILKLLNAGEKDPEVYAPFLDNSSCAWSISVFSKMLSEMKLVYLCGGTSVLSSYINKKISDI